MTGGPQLADQVVADRPAATCHVNANSIAIGNELPADPHSSIAGQHDQVVNEKASLVEQGLPAKFEIVDYAAVSALRWVYQY